MAVNQVDPDVIAMSGMMTFMNMIGTIINIL